MASGSPKTRRIGLAILYLASLGAVGAWLARGADFYRTPLAGRPRHPDYAWLTAGGEWGHAFGIAGTALILLLLLYIPRKRWKSLQGLGSLRTWLDVHIWMGVTGPLLILLHSAFKVEGLVSFSFWSMVAVAVSGVLGRYLYLQIPRDEDGEELDAAGVQSRQEQWLAEGGLQTAHLSGPLQRWLARPAGGPLTWLGEDLAWPWRRAAWARELREAGHPQVSAALRALRRLELLQRRRGTLERARRLLHHWHVFHRPFAFLMVFFLIIHVATALLFTSDHGLPR